MESHCRSVAFNYINDYISKIRVKEKNKFIYWKGQAFHRIKFLQKNVSNILFNTEDAFLEREHF